MGMPWRLFCAAILALVLSIIPLPAYLYDVRPAWVLLLVLYVQAYFPAYFHVLGMVFLGVCLDVLGVTPIGEHAFALIIITWSLAGLMQRFLFYSMVQQLLIVGLACIGYQAILYVANASFGYPSMLAPMAGIAILTMLCWPALLKILLERDEPRRHYMRSL